MLPRIEFEQVVSLFYFAIHRKIRTHFSVCICVPSRYIANARSSRNSEIFDYPHSPRLFIRFLVLWSYVACPDCKWRPDYQPPKESIYAGTSANQLHSLGKRIGLLVTVMGQFCLGSGRAPLPCLCRKSLRLY